MNTPTPVTLDRAASTWHSCRLRRKMPPAIAAAIHDLYLAGQRLLMLIDEAAAAEAPDEDAGGPPALPGGSG